MLCSCEDVRLIYTHKAQGAVDDYKRDFSSLSCLELAMMRGGVSSHVALALEHLDANLGLVVGCG